MRFGRLLLVAAGLFVVVLIAVAVLAANQDTPAPVDRATSLEFRSCAARSGVELERTDDGFEITVAQLAEHGEALLACAAGILPGTGRAPFECEPAEAADTAECRFTRPR